MELKFLYQDLILDHGKNPRNFKILDKTCDSIVAHNPLCGDKIEIFALLERDIIKDISFRGNGCAICLAASSIMTELVIKKNINEKTNQAKNNAMKEVNQLSTIIAVESAKKLISQTIEKNKIEEINFSSVKENLENLKKNI